MKKSLFVCAAAVAAMATSAMADTYYVRGDFNGWSNNADPMVQTGPNSYEYLVTGLTPGQAYEFKATVDDWSMSAPGSNAKHVADANGELFVTLFDTDSHGDGWNPEGKWRLGYADGGAFDWEIVGDMNGWGGGSDWHLADYGGGWHWRIVSLSAGTYQFKFRQQGSWDFNIGDDFGNSAGNNEIFLAEDSQVEFVLDLVNGRWTAHVIPTPGSAMILGVAGLCFVPRRRRR
ncbi:MAG: hypothetical protein D8M59_04990 [Planctomycetes bacterium]|nr:hypothetical protein [Planctomycetota bacterium]NOG56064.1 hypothetical protein [Planctomycetota bacterium]